MQRKCVVGGNKLVALLLDLVFALPVCLHRVGVRWSWLLMATSIITWLSDLASSTKEEVNEHYYYHVRPAKWAGRAHSSVSVWGSRGTGESRQGFQH